MFTNAVFQGGGVKGIALVGALKRMEENGIKFNAVGGTSAGAIVASLYACGYTADEMKSLLDSTNFEKFLDGSIIPFKNLITQKGLYKGNALYNWIYDVLKVKNIIKFEDLKEIDLKIVATDLTNKELIIFDRNSNPSMKIAEAVRMSTSIPLVFSPYKLGEKLVVDGGILSNYPLFIFKDPENTVGFKLISKATTVPTAPDNLLGFLYAIANTMMDAHDKEDERQLGHKNTIHIDNAGVSTTKFNLNETEKKLLYQNGYYAASQFVNDNVSVLTDKIKKIIKIESPFSESIIVDVPDDLPDNELIRLSISGLFKIYIDGKYLLVPGRRIQQYQPVGGVFKRLQKSVGFLEELGVVADNMLNIDDVSRDDLRVRVPLGVLPRFLEWYRSEKGREITPEREFREELLETNILPKDLFKYIFYERIHTHVSGIKESHYFHCKEVLIAEIYELNPTPEQKLALIDLMQKQSGDYIWLDAGVIRAKGYDMSQKGEVARVSETASWIL